MAMETATRKPKVAEWQAGWGTAADYLQRVRWTATHSVSGRMCFSMVMETLLSGWFESR